jgi:hypothetical protein
VQEEIGNTWVGFVGPGIAQRGVDDRTWTDHTNLRPTILALAGLHDDYQHDGRVLVEALTSKATPARLRSPMVVRLAETYEQLNAPFGQFGADTLAASTKALASGSTTDDTTYTRIETAIATLTAQRDTLARQIAVQLDRAAFDHQEVGPIHAVTETARADQLIAAAHQLARSTG